MPPLQSQDLVDSQRETPGILAAMAGKRRVRTPTASPAVEAGAGDGNGERPTRVSPVLVSKKEERPQDSPRAGVLLHGTCACARTRAFTKARVQSRVCNVGS